MHTVKDSYIALITTTDLQELCKPLTELLGINNFAYHKIFPNGQEICLSNNPNWIKYVHQNNLTFGVKLDSLETPNFKSLLWPFEDEIKEHKSVIKGYRAVRSIWDCHYGIDLSNGHNEYFGFAAHKKDISTVNNYLNNLEQLERFTTFFLEKAEGLIKQASQDKLLYYQQKRADTFSNKLSAIKDKFIEQTPITTYPPHLDLVSGLKFTHRELDCIKLFIKGYTLNDAAGALSISKRTVETHLENIKNKTGVNTKSDLIKFVFENNMDKYF